MDFTANIEFFYSVTKICDGWMSRIISAENIDCLLSNVGLVDVFNWGGSCHDIYILYDRN